VLQRRSVLAGWSAHALQPGKVAWGTQATWHHVHFGLKSAPHRRDFRPERKRSA